MASFVTIDGLCTIMVYQGDRSVTNVIKIVQNGGPSLWLTFKMLNDCIF